MMYRYTKNLVPLAGIGPATSPLPRECSTTEPQGQTKPETLLYYLTQHMERETGIEPASLAWKARVLPLNYSRTTTVVALAYLVEEAGFEPA